MVFLTAIKSVNQPQILDLYCLKIPFSNIPNSSTINTLYAFVHIYNRKPNGQTYHIIEESFKPVISILALLRSDNDVDRREVWATSQQLFNQKLSQKSCSTYKEIQNFTMENYGKKALVLSCTLLISIFPLFLLDIKIIKIIKADSSLSGQLQQ